MTSIETSAAPLVGRARECRNVDGLLAEHRLITITGVGGIGKTRLALEIARTRSAAHRERVLWADLAPLRDESLVGAAVAVSGGFSLPAEGDPDAATVRALRDEDALVVLDNCEHLVGRVARLVALIIDACPTVRVLATSREPLGVPGEVVYRVPPLSLPGAPATVEAAGSSESVALFIERARRARPGFTVDAGNVEAVVEVCRRLDGIPLAIELAAARVRALAPAEIAAALADRFGLLRSGPRTAADRQRTLEGSLDWSWGLLTDHERLVLARMTVFSGGFSLSAAQPICGDHSVSTTELVNVLSSLVDRSLLEATEDSASEYRYRLLETVREYAAARLDGLDDADRVRERHLAFYLIEAANAQARLGGELAAGIAAASRDLDNYRAAMEWAAASSRPLLVVQITEALYMLWSVLGLYAEAQRRLRDALQDGTIGDAARARGLANAAIFALMAGRPGDGYDLATQAVRLANTSDDVEAPTLSRIYRAWTGFQSGRAAGPQLWDDVETAIRYSQDSGDSALQLRVRFFAGALELLGRSVEAGTSSLAGVLEFAEQVQLHQLTVPAHAFLGMGGVVGGRVDEARRHCEAAIALGEPIGYHQFVFMSLWQLGMYDVLDGEERAARSHFDRARRVAEDAGLGPSFEPNRLLGDAANHFRTGATALGRDAAERAVAVAAALTNRYLEATAQWATGIGTLVDGDVATARRWLEAARSTSENPGYPSTLGRAKVGLAYVAIEEDDLEQAWGLAHDALDVLAGYGDRAGIIDALESIAAVAVSTGRAELGGRLLGATARLRAESVLLFDTGFRDRTVAAARAELGQERLDECLDAGAALDERRAVSYARRGRGTRGRPRAGWQGLTPAEVEVVRLVAAGHTNAEIAERLYVSANTVKTHLSHAYAKIGVATRAELASEATRRDL